MSEAIPIPPIWNIKNSANKMLSQIVTFMMFGIRHCGSTKELAEVGLDIDRLKEVVSSAEPSRVRITLSHPTSGFIDYGFIDYEYYEFSGSIFLPHKCVKLCKLGCEDVYAEFIRKQANTVVLRDSTFPTESIQFRPWSSDRLLPEQIERIEVWDTYDYKYLRVNVVGTRLTKDHSIESEYKCYYILRSGYDASDITCPIRIQSPSHVDMIYEIKSVENV